MRPPRALLLYEEDGSSDSFRALIRDEGCELVESALETNTPAPVDGYCLVVFDINRVTARLFGVVQAWHDALPDTSLIIAGKRTAPTHRIALLETGVLAYLTKPVVAGELRARVRAALRRARSQDHRSRMVWFGAGTIDLDARVVRAANHDVSLTPTEFGILEHLVSHANHTVPSDELVKMLWGADPQRGVHSLRLFIRKLRQKLEPDPTRPQFLVTEPTVGYRLTVPAEALEPNPSEKPR